LSKRSRQNRCGLKPKRLAGVRRPLRVINGSVLDDWIPDDVAAGINTGTGCTWYRTQMLRIDARVLQLN
jgi:hypothetical protein